MLIIGVLSSLAVLGGILINRPRHVWPWVLLLASLVLINTGDAIWSYYEIVLEIESPFPAPPDAIYIGGYFALIASLVLFIRRRSRGRDAGSLIDATIVATGVGVVSWIYLMEPYANDASMPIFSRLVSIAYPLLDVLALALVARLLLAPGKRPTAFYLLSVGLLIQLVTDTAFVALVLSGRYFTGHPIDVGWIGFYALASLAALHPSMRGLSDPDPERGVSLARWRIGLLAVASLLAPGMLAMQYVADNGVGTSINVPVIAGASAMLFLLVLARVLGVVRKHERAVVREKTLRRSGAALVGALDRKGIYSAALDATIELSSAAPEARVGLALGSEDGMTVVASAGFRASEIEGKPFDAGALPAPLHERFLANRSVEMEAGTSTDAALESVGSFARERSFFAVPLFVQGKLRGMLGLTSGPSSLSEEVKDGLEGLGAQVALALESASLREDLHERRSEDRFRSLVQNSSDVILILDTGGLARYVSPSIERVLGYGTEEIAGTNGSELFHPEDYPRIRGELYRVLETPGLHPPVWVRVRHADGSWRHLEAICNNLVHDPNVGGVVVNCRDVTERREAEQRLAEAEARYRTLVEQMPAVTYVHAQAEPGRPVPTLYVSPQTEALTSYPPEAFVEDPDLWLKLVHPDDHERVLAEELRTQETGDPFETEYRVVRRDGGVVWLRDKAVLVRDAEGRPLFWQGVQLDVTERKEFEEKLEHQAFHDALTGLPNRALFMDRLQRALAAAERNGRAAALLFLDLDRFKVVNDSLGHEIGDNLLVAVGGRIRDCLGPGATVARIGGDEFAILLEDVSGPEDAVAAANRITAALAAPFFVDGREMVATTSIGIALGSFADDPSDLLRDADIAMYRAKDGGKARYEVFDPSMNAHALHRLELENELRRAIERGEMRVHYQPNVDLNSGAVVGTEALVRWEHPERGLVHPGEFIPLAEETGLILPLGRWVLREACRQEKEWQGRQPAPRMISVNLSARQFQQKGLVDEISEILQETGLRPSSLILEITESVLIEDAATKGTTLSSLKDLGVRVAIDDFGTGYSSLSYLKRFPVDVLKIDRSFVRGLGEDAGATAIVQAIIDLGDALGLDLVAEGIETAEHADRLRKMGCRVGQGFYFAKPLPAAGSEETLLLAPPLASAPEDS